MAPCGEEQGVFAGATARIENRADDLIGGGLERRLGLADVPGRAAGVRAAKGFAVVCQDVVGEKTSVSRAPLYTQRPSELSKLISSQPWETISLIRTNLQSTKSGQGSVAPISPCSFHRARVGSGHRRAEPIACGG